VDLDTGVPHPARVYDYILGGKDNFAADQAAAQAAMATNPHVATAMRANRAVMRRMAAFLARDRGIRQFLDIGTGLPTSPNMHEIVQAIASQAHIVYVDNDPIVLAHARALLSSGSDGSCAYLDADLREPGKILADPQLQLVPPGIVPMAEWRADDEPQPRPSPLEAGGYAAVGRKD
jgi:hypothetical protein